MILLKLCLETCLDVNMLTRKYVCFPPKVYLPSFGTQTPESHFSKPFKGCHRIVCRVDPCNMRIYMFEICRFLFLTIVFCYKSLNLDLHSITVTDVKYVY